MSLEQQSSKKTAVVMGCSMETAQLRLERRQEEPWRLTRERSKRTFLPSVGRAVLAKSSLAGSEESAANTAQHWGCRGSLLLFPRLSRSPGCLLSEAKAPFLLAPLQKGFELVRLCLSPSPSC